MAKPLMTTKEIEAALGGLGGWELEEGGKAITRSFKFASFVDAFAFMTASALTAEKMDHHPEWSNVYNTVNVRLMTHDSGGVTEMDIALANAMDKAAA